MSIDLASLASEYDSASADPSAEAVTLWKASASYFFHRARMLAESVSVIVSDDPEPYASSADQSADIDRGRFIVSRANCEHPVWSVNQNVFFRICHDIDGHHAARSGFDLLGELRAYATEAPIIPVRFVPVLFCESVLQLASTLENGAFPAQKILISAQLSVSDEIVRRFA